MSNAITISIRLRVEFGHEGPWVVATCPDLDVCSQGEDLASAKRNIEEALRLFFEFCLEHGTLNEVLLRSGYAKTAKMPEYEEGEQIDISIPFLSAQSFRPCRI